MEKKGIAVAGSILADVIITVSKYPKEGELLPRFVRHQELSGAACRMLP